MVRDREATLHNFLLQVLVIRALERKTTVQHCVQQHPTGLNVDRRPTVLLLEHDLGRHLARRAAEDAHLLVVGDAGREAEVDQLHVLPLVEQHVFQFDVAVRDALAVALA